MKPRGGGDVESQPERVLRPRFENASAPAAGVLHVSPQNSIHARLIAWALSPEPFEHIVVDAK